MEDTNNNNNTAPNMAVVILGCTANPPHQGHLHCLKEARTRAIQLGYNVAFTTIAVAPLGYVRKKMKWKKRGGNNSWVLDDARRLRVLELTADGMDGKSFGFQAPTRTFGSAMECGRFLRPNGDTTVIVVVGGDRFKWKKNSHNDVVTLCCPRSEEECCKLKKMMERDVREGLVADWQLLSGGGPPTSSTIIRTIIEDETTTRDQKVQELVGEHGYPEEAARLLLLDVTGQTAGCDATV